jgi:hypothetical protein
MRSQISKPVLESGPRSASCNTLRGRSEKMTSIEHRTALGVSRFGV